MILQRYLIKECLLLTLLISLVLLAISLISQLNIYLLAVVNGNLELHLLIPILLSFMPQYLSVVLPLAFFLAIIITLNQMQRANELVILNACGIDRNTIARMLLPLVILLFGCALVLSLFVTPYSTGKAQDILTIQENLDTLDTITPRTFIKISGTTTLYTETLSEDKKYLNHVYLLDNAPQSGDKEQVIYAPTARIIRKDTIRYVQLDNGYQIQAVPGSADITRINFERLLIKLPPRSAIVRIARKESLDNSELLASDDPQIYQYFFWRLTLAICVPVLFVIGLYMFISRVRQDNSGKNFFVLFISCLLYMGGNTVVFSLASDGVIKPELGYATIHLLGLAAAIAFYRLYARGT